MSAFAGVQGYETLSSAQQRERGAGSAADQGLAPKPSAPPPQLSRVLYIPSHRSSELHALVYDVSAEYKHAISHAPLGGGDIIGDALMGSRLFVTRLGTMEKPTAGTPRCESQYAVDAKVDTTGASLTLRGSRAGDVNRSVTISLPSSTDDFSLTDDEEVDVAASFPVPDTTSSAGTARHPFFTFPSRDGSKELQWQVHPAESGPLRYTLVEIEKGPTQDVEEQWTRPENIRAVYHHIGQSPSLSMPSSEGVLLLHPIHSVGHVTEEMALASLLGLLWRVRGMDPKPHAENEHKGGRKSFLHRVFVKE